VARRRHCVLWVLVLAGLIGLVSVSTSLAWLNKPHRRIFFLIWQWAHAHVFNVAAAGLVVAVAGLVAAVVVSLLIAIKQRHWAWRDRAEERHRARSRSAMLRRVRKKWIKGVLEPSFGNAPELNIQFKSWPSHQKGHNSQFDSPLGMSIGSVFLEAEGGLVILGGVGSGKTTALLKLTCDLIDQAEADDEQPMPVVFNLSSWAARRLPLIEWLVDEIRKGYDVPKLTAMQWVIGDEVLPLLDGLDEVADACRVDCVNAVEEFQQEHGLTRFVVCSRTEDYVNISRHLRAEVVELQPLARQQIYDYLADPIFVSVREVLDTDETFWELLQSPLVLNIVALTYRARAVDSLRAADILEQRLTPLFKSYTERMLEHRTGHYAPNQILLWLTWLARSMRDRSLNEFQLDRLEFDWLATKMQQRLAVLALAIGTGLIAGLIDGAVYALVYGAARGLANGLAIGLFFALFVGMGHVGPNDGFRWSWLRVRTRLLGGLILGLTDWLAFSLVDAIVFGLAFVLVFALFALFAGLKKMDPAEQIRWSWPKSSVGLLVGSIFGLVIGPTYGLAYGLISGLVPAIAFGLVFALAAGLYGGLVTGLVPALVDSRVTPNEGIHRSARHALASVLITGSVFGLIFGLSFKLIFNLAHGLGGGIRDGLVLGLAVGLVVGGLACLQHLVLRGLLTCFGFAPLNYVRFLDEAVELLLLRRAGSGYIFNHRLLRDYFADSAFSPVEETAVRRRASTTADDRASVRSDTPAASGPLPG
jgi:hypothetical protein